MYNHYENRPSVKGLKGLDSTRLTTNAKATLMNSNNTLINSMKTNGESTRESKLDNAYWKARNLIDQLIGAVQDKKDLSRKGIKTVGDTNEYVLDCYQDSNFFAPNHSEVQRKPYEQMSEVDLTKLEMLRIIENQRQEKESLNRKYNNLHQQNSQLRYSNAQSNQGNSLFSELQFLKQENEELRQNAIKLLRYEYD